MSHNTLQSTEEESPGEDAEKLLYLLFLLAQLSLMRSHNPASAQSAQGITPPIGCPIISTHPNSDLSPVRPTRISPNS